MSQRILHLRVHAHTQIFTVQRRQRGGRIHRIAGLQLGTFGQKQRHKFIGHRFGNNNALGCIARLAGIAETRIAGFFRRRGQIGIGHHDKSIAAAQFEHRFFQMQAGMGGQTAAGGGGAGKRHRIGMFDGAQGIVMVEPGRLKRQMLTHQLKQSRRYPRHARCRLHQTGIAGAQSRHGKTQHLPHRIIPRHHRQHHADGLEAHLAQARLRGDGFVCQQLGRQAHVIADKRHRFIQLGLTFAQAAPHFFTHHFGQPAARLGELVGQVVQKRRALGYRPRGKSLLRPAQCCQLPLKIRPCLRFFAV